MDVSLHRDEYIDLCAGYALGSLDEGDRARLERHLAEGCEACEKALRDFSIGAQLLAGSLPAEPVGSALRDRVMIAAGSTRQGIPPVPEGEGGDGGERTPAKVIKLDRPRRTSAFPALGWAVAAGFAIAAALFWSKLETARTDLAKLRDEQRWAAVMNAPGARLAQLAPTPQAAAPLKGRAYVDPASGRAVLVLEGVQAPQGRDYELWAIRGGAPRSLGLVHADAAGHAVMHLENVGDPATLAAFAVSLEPKGGAPTPDAPTGPVVLVGKVEG
jgi:anti-sigma-K factor RskA